MSVVCARLGAHLDLEGVGTCVESRIVGCAVGGGVMFDERALLVDERLVRWAECNLSVC